MIIPVDTLHRIDVANATQRMGFGSTARSMAAFCALELGDQPFPLGGVSCGPVSGLSDNLGGAKAAGMPQAARGGCFSRIHMSTTTTHEPAPAAGMFARKVAQVTGLSELALDRLHTEDMGGPKHFFYQPGVAGGFVYTLAGLGRLVEILHAEGHKGGALALRAELDKLRPALPAPVAPAGVNVRGEWQPKGVAA